MTQLLPDVPLPQVWHAVQPSDDLRHGPEPGGRMRDSVYYQVTLRPERLAVQVYLYLTGTGRAGYHVAAWGDDREPVVEVGGGRVPDDADFTDLAVGELRLRHTDPLAVAEVRCSGADLTLDLSFHALHEAFSYTNNPDGLPAWFAADRFEQTGQVSGTLRLGSRTVRLDGVGQRDHSWGARDWSAAQHWKWFVAYTPSGRAVNGWVWMARGEWGFAGYVLREGRPVPVSRIEADTTYADGLAQRRLTGDLLDVEGGRTPVTLDVFGLLRVPDERTGTAVREGACVATVAGEPGAGQFEAAWPLAYLRAYLRAPRTRNRSRSRCV